MTLLDVSIVNVAIPSIESSLGAGPAELQWIVAGYTLTFGLMLVPAGKLGDVFGRRTLFLVGLAGFVVTSALCGMVTSGGALAVMRLLQGLTSGIVTPQVTALIQELFRGPERGRAFGMFGVVIGVSTAIGPLLGGVLLAVFGVEHGWRAVFLVNVPIGLVLLPLAWRLLPRPTARSGAVSLDLMGTCLLAAGVLAFMYPFVVAGEGAEDAVVPWWLLAVSGALILVFLWWERRVEARGREPLFPSSMLRIRGFTFGGGVSTFYFAGFAAIFLISTLYLQTGLGLAPWQAGLTLTPFAVIGAVSSFLGGRWVGVYGRKVVVAGLMLMIGSLLISQVVILVVDGPRAAVWLAVVLVVAGFGNGIVITPNQTLTLAEIPVRSAGVAAGALQTAQRVGAAVGVAITAGIFFSSLAADGDYSAAFSRGLWLVIALMTLALIASLLDAARRSEETPRGPTIPDPGVG